MKKLIYLFGIMLFFAASTFAQTLTIGSATGNAGDTISVPINVTNLTNTGAISLKISYDSSVLTYVGVANSAVTFTNNASGGVVTLGWFDATASNPLTISSGKLVDLKFVTNGGTSNLSFVTSQCELSNSSGTTITTTDYTNGGVNLTTGPVLTIGTKSSATSGDSITVPVNVQKFTNIGAISLKIQYDASVLTFNGIANPYNGITITNNASSGVITLGWFDATGTNPITTDSAKLVDLKFLFTGGNSNLSFLTAQCDLSNNLGTSLNDVAYNDGSVSGSSSSTPTLKLDTITADPNTNVSVPLTVKSFTNVGAVSLKITYDASVLTFTGIANAPAGVTFTSSASNGVISLGWYDATGTSPLNIANGKLVDLKFAYASGSSNLGFTTAQCEISNASGTALTGITYTDGMVKQNSTGAPTLSIGTINATQNTSISVPVSVQSLTKIGAISLKIAYNSSVLTFTGVANSPTGVTFTANATGGVITLGWYDATGTTPLTMASGKLVDLQFSYGGGSSDLTFNTSQCELANSSGTALTDVTYNNGKVQESVAGGPSLTISKVISAPNTSLSVPVTAMNFNSIGAVSLKISYNATALTFTGVANTPTGVTFTSNASNGVITLGWYDATGTSPITLDSAKLLDLNFTYNGGSSNLNFSTSQCEIADNSGTSLTNVAYNDGSVSQQVSTVPTFTLPTVVTAPNSSIVVPVMAKKLSHVGAVSLKIQYNAAVLLFEGAENTYGGLSISSSANAGVLTLGWFDATGTHPINVDSAKFIDLKFTLISGNTDLTFLSDQSEVSDSIGQVITGVNYVNGKITANNAPSFVHMLPDTSITGGADTLKFQYSAQDADNQALTFALASGPTGATVSSSGMLTWVAPNVDSTFKIVASVTDGLAFAYDTAMVTVTKNKAPYFTSVLTDGVKVMGRDSVLKFQYKAKDPENQPLTFGLVKAPAGMTITSSGAFTYAPPLTHKDVPVKAIVFVKDKYNTVYDTALITVTPVTGITQEGDGLPTQYQLSQNYPNPFNPSTTIKFSLPQETKVVLKIYNLLGQEVYTLVNRDLSAGYYNYEFNANNLPSGIYIYRLQAGSYLSTKKMTLLK